MEELEPHLKCGRLERGFLRVSSLYRLNRGDTQGALEGIERAVQFDPNGALTLAGAATVYNAIGRTDDGRAAVDRAMLVAPDNITINVFGAVLATDAATAERFARNVERLAPEQGVWGLMSAAAVYRRFGKDAEAEAALDRYAELADAQGVGDADWAQYYLLGRNDLEATYERLEKAVVKYERGEGDPGFVPLVARFLNPAARGVAPDPRLAEPRFQRLFDRLRALTQQ